MKRFNTWEINKTENGGDYEATFTKEDFDTWFDAGDEQKIVTPLDKGQLYENCLYLAEAESRRITQTSAELKKDIKKWAINRNNEENKNENRNRM